MAPPDEPTHVTNDEAAKSSKSAPARNSPSMPGGDLVVAWVVIATIWKIVRHRTPWRQAFLETLGDLSGFVSAVLTSLPVRILFALGIVAAAGALLGLVTKRLKEKNYGPDHVLTYLGTFFPIKVLAQAVTCVTEFNASIERTLSGKTPWFVAYFTLVATIGSLDGLETFVSLPPMKASVGSSIYQASAKQLKAGTTNPDGLLLTSVPDLLQLRANKTQVVRRFDRIPAAIWQHRDEWLFTEAGLERELMRETVMGTSFLGGYLEWVYEIRTGSDLLAMLPPEFGGRDVLKKTVDDLERTSKLDKAIQDIALLALMVPFAFGLRLAGAKRWPLLRMLGVSCVLWTLLLIVQEAVYVSTSFATMIWVAHFLGSLSQFLVLQLCLLLVLPKAIDIPARRCWMGGTAAYAFVQIVAVVVVLTML